MLRPDTFALTALLALLTGLGPLSTDLYLPSMTDIGRSLAASPAQVQFTLSSYLIGIGLGQILYGPVSDRHGRKRVLLAALGLYCVASFVCCAANSIEMLIAARFLQALGGSGAIVLARAIVRDLYSGARAGRELSLMSAVMAIAPVVAPVIGGVVQTGFGWRATFVVLVAIGIAAFLTVWRLLPETLRERALEPVSFGASLRSFGVLARNRIFVVHTAAVALSYGGLFAWISGASFVLQDLYGLTPFTFGLAFAATAAGYMTGAVFAARIVSRIGLERTIGLGACALALGGLVMLLALALAPLSVLSLILPMAIYTAGIGLVLPQSFAGALTPFPERAGAASSLIGFVQQMSAAIIGAGIGQLLVSAWPIALTLALMGVLTVLLWAFARPSRI
jgi:DHA1 family bicyclomycin/chloramphenicol resistance-like MFS transporter